jgi:hypothetical protein
VRARHRTRADSSPGRRHHRRRHVGLDGRGNLAFLDAINDFFREIVEGGPDIAVVDLHGVIIAGDQIGVSAPMGSGQCPADSNLPQYRHVLTEVGSGEALSKIVSTYDRWSASLRPGATKTFIVVSDDPGSDMASSVFSLSLVALDPSLAGFVFYGIVPMGTCGTSDDCQSDHEVQTRPASRRCRLRRARRDHGGRDHHLRGIRLGGRGPVSS